MDWPGWMMGFLHAPLQEGGAGADVMIQEGALEDVEAAFGVHVMPMVPTGSIAVRSGTIMAGE